MKRTMIVVLTLVLFGCSIGQGASKDPIQSSTDSVTNEPSEELKKVVESLVDVKSIEWEIVFGYPIEDVRLLDNLQEGRNIPYVVEHFEKYYEEEVLDQFLYYLKRSTSQTFYKEIGVFWGDNYAVVGNVYKREATDITYDIEYTSIDIIDDVTIVSTRVTPIYHGDYVVRGVESKSYESDSKELVFHIRKTVDDGYKLTQLSKDVIEDMEEEIGERINLNQIKEEASYYELDGLNYESDSQKVAIYLVYDILSRLKNGGVDALYDQYDNVWLSVEHFESKYATSGTLGWITKYDFSSFEDILNRNDPLKYLIEGYAGWDYGYLLDVWPWIDVQSRNSLVLVFDTNEENDIVRVAFMYNTEADADSQLKKYEDAIQDLGGHLNQEINVSLGVNGGVVFTPQDLENKVYQYYYENFLSSGALITQEFNSGRSLYGEINQDLIDVPRKVETGRMPYWITKEESGYFALVYPHGKSIIDPYTDAELISGRYTFAESEEHDSELAVDIEVALTYFYPDINLYIYSPARNLPLRRKEENEKWKVGYFYPQINLSWPYHWKFFKD